MSISSEQEYESVQRAFNEMYRQVYYLGRDDLRQELNGLCDQLRAYRKSAAKSKREQNARRGAGEGKA